MQPVDYTTLAAARSEVQAILLPARLEQVYQRDRFTISLALRTLKQRSWLDISWHPQAARICIGQPPPRTPDTFTFSEQLRHQLGGLALAAIAEVSPWERVLDFQFAKRPGESPLWHLYVEVIGKYSNVILTTKDNLIVTCAHQVGSQQSSVRQIQTGQPYDLPPSLTEPTPTLTETRERWEERIALVPGPLWRNLIKNYRGLSKALVLSMLQAASLERERTTDTLNSSEWDRLFEFWQQWLLALENANFQPHRTKTGYSVIGWEEANGQWEEANGQWEEANGQWEEANRQDACSTGVQELLDRYYTDELNQQEFSQLRHQITQKLNNVLAKLRQKADGFRQRLQQSDKADQWRSQADLLMANLHQWQPGMKTINLPDFETGEPVSIPLNPEKNAVQNAQALYKQHQKLKRARTAVEPLLASVEEEINYLEQVEASISQLESYSQAQDLETLEEIREELIEQGYLKAPNYRRKSKDKTAEFHSYQTPSGFELLIGRNNRQNDLLTFKVAKDYDLWFHTQEIPGSHVLLRLEPGAAPEEADFQFVANMSAYYSRARQSEQVPVVYTQPKFVYKPKGAKPGMVVYKREQVLWGQPQQASQYVTPTAKKKT